MQYPTTTFTPTTTWTTVSTAIYAGEYSAYNVVAGNIYEFSTCTADGGSSTYDNELTLFNSTNTLAPLAYADQSCGNNAKITWTASFTGVAYVQVNLYPCSTNQTGTTVVCRYTPGSTGNPPANDNCANATNIPLGSFCNGVSGTLVNATGSVTPAACVGTNTDDVWYRVVSNGSPSINFEVTPNGAGFDPVMQIFNGSSCSNLTEITCIDAFADAGAEFYTLNGAAAGQVFYIRIYDYFTSPAADPSFTFCAYAESSTVPPLNDNCISATNVSVNTFCSGVVGTLTNATGSASPATCTGTNTDDVWYRFVCDGSQVINFECIPNGTGFDPVMQVFVGNNCNALTDLACVDLTLDGQAEVWGIDGAPAGQVVYVRVFDYYSTPAANPNFTFCVYSGSLPAVPGDICETAIQLPTTTNCTNPTAGNFGEFNSDAGLGFDCTSPINSDVWYTFTSLSDSVFFDITPFGSTNPIAEVYEGFDCASLINVGCGDFSTEGFAENLVLAPITAGTQYFVRLYDGSGNVANNLDYEFCVYDTFGSSGNNSSDDCFGATVVTEGTACSPVFGDLSGATASSPATQCGGFNTDDVWFELVTTDTAMIIQLAPEYLEMDLAAEIFYSQSGDCSGIVSFGCANDSTAGQGELLYITGIQPGESLWLRVYDAGFTPIATPTFAMCAWFDAAVFGVENDECDNSTVIQAGQVCNPILGTLANSSASLPLTQCAGTNTDDVWYQIVASDTAFTIDVTPTGASLDAVMEFFYSTTGDCSGLVSIGCIDNTANGAAESVDVIGLFPGATIWVRVYDYFSGDVADPEFTVCAYWNPDQIFDNNECLGAVALTPGTTCNPVPFSVANATGSTPTSSCSPGGLVEADVWFSFVAQTTSARINVAAVNGSDPVIQYFSGTCGNLISRGCSDFFIEGFDENLTATGLIIGQTYFVRVYDYRGAASPANDFT
ncbi:MAG: hypothetical protein ACK5B6_09505, partial [Bacteroidia bacterium]